MPNHSLAEAAARAGAAAWAENRLYEVVGGWVPSSTSAAAKIYFDSASQHHAWRAQLWLDRLPARLLVRPPSAAGGGWELEAVKPLSQGEPALMKTLGAVEGDVARLGAYCRVVLPRTLDAYRKWRAACSPVSDGPVSRVLDIVFADTVSDWHEGTSVLVELLSDKGEGQASAAAGEAAASAAEVERALLEGGRAQGA